MSEKHDRRAAAEAARKAEERKQNIFYASIAILFVVVAIALLVYNSNFFQRQATAVTIGETTYNAEDVNYYYYQTVNEVYNYTYGYPTMIGLDTSTSFKKQPFDEETARNYIGHLLEEETAAEETAATTEETATEEGAETTEEATKTWHDFFLEKAIEQLTFVQAANEAAAEEGFTLTEDMEAEINEIIENMKATAASNGMSYGAYLSNVYGSIMTADGYERNLRKAFLAQEYTEKYSDEYTAGYTADEVNAVYEADKNAYDKVEYKLVTIDGTVPAVAEEETTETTETTDTTDTTDTTETAETTEPTEEDAAELFEEAKNTAQLLLDANDAGEDLEAAANDFANATYAYSEGANYTQNLYMDWLFDSARKTGDSTILEDTASSKIYVVVFMDRFLDETKTVDVRHILITEESVEGLPENATATDEEIEAKAEEVFAAWDGTEDGFITLAKEYSKDSNAADGGIYENVAKGQMVTEFEDWCFDSARQPGDTGIVKTEYGYHIMYFVGDNDPVWYVTARNTLLVEDMEAWEETLVAPYTATTDASGLSYVGR